MAIRTIPLTYRTPLEEICRLAASRGVDCRGQKEIFESFNALLRWNDVVGTSLIELCHRDSGDDPPDLIARFEDGTEIAIEHTTIDPQHHRYAERIRCEVDPDHQSSANILPVSQPTFDREEILRKSYPAGEVTFELVSDSDAAWRDIVTKAILRKNDKYPTGGILVLSSTECFWNESTKKNFERAFADARNTADLTSWRVLLISQWNQLSWCSAYNDCKATRWRESR